MALKDVLIDELRDMYSAENQLVKALPKMVKAAQSDALRKGFEQHLAQTKGHVDRLEQIFSAMDKSPKGSKCAGMEGLVEEGEEVIREQSGSDALDSGLIASAQRVEHYEIAGYGTVRTFAELLGEEEAVNLLQQTLDEEKETDEKLTELAKQVNAQAMNSGDKSEMDEEGAESMRRGKRSAKAKSARA